MAERYSSVLEMAHRSIQDEEFNHDLETHLNERYVSSSLCVYRCSNGITQEQLAEKSGISLEEIERIENCTNDELSIKDLIVFANAFDMKTTILFDAKEIEPIVTVRVESIKKHVLKIKKELDELADMVQNDHVIHENVKSFYGEYFYNVLGLFLDSTLRLQGLELDNDARKQATLKLMENMVSLMEPPNQESVATEEERRPYIIEPEKVR